MKHLRIVSILAAVLTIIAACAEAPTAPRNAPDQASFNGTPPTDSAGRGVYFGGGH